MELVALAGAGVLLVSVLAVRVSTRLGLPSLLLYLGIGVAIGEAGLGLRFDDAGLSQTLGLAALVVILTEGGLTTRWHAVRPAVPLAILLSTVGVAVSVAVTASAAVVLLDTGWRTGLLLGAIVSSTDAAAVFSTLRLLGLPPRLTATLEMESGINDAPVIILVTLLSTGATGSPVEVVGLILYELVIGAVIGVLVAVAAARMLREGALPAAGLYPLAVLAVAVGSYALATVAHASGFLAAYLTGLVLGNVTLPHRRATLGFVEGLAWLAQIGLFVLLGLLVSPTRLDEALLPALGIGAALLLLARPLSVLASCVWFRVRWAEQLFVSWAGLRGAVPIVLCTIPLTAGVAEARGFFDLVFVLVVVFTLVQGTTLAPLAKVLGLASDAEPRDVEVDAAPLEDLDADLLQVRIPDRSRLHGVLVRELRLPPGAVVSLLVRAGEGSVPGPDTRLRRGDQLLVVTTGPARAEAERRLRAVGRAGRLADWLGETGRRRD
ncbi:MAG TPA: potassium/proton antiporter [Mycobacteriales bacterium]|nr:potassium/proton antiporter [Mycobacteriales bacterium]